MFFFCSVLCNNPKIEWLKRSIRLAVWAQTTNRIEYVSFLTGIDEKWTVWSGEKERNWLLELGAKIGVVAWNEIHVQLMRQNVFVRARAFFWSNRVMYCVSRTEHPWTVCVCFESNPCESQELALMNFAFVQHSLFYAWIYVSFFSNDLFVGFSFYFCLFFPLYFSSKKNLLYYTHCSIPWAHCREPLLLFFFRPFE